MSTASKPSAGESGGKAGKKMADPSLNLDELRELASLVIEHGFTDFEFENENIRVRLSKATAVQMVQAPPQLAPSSVQSSAPSSGSGASESAAAASEEDLDAELYKIVSPIVGTFYRSPGPDKEPYVSEGTRISADSTVCIVEAMKLMNEIQAETFGEIVKIYVNNGDPVEYGQPLFGVRQ